MPTIHALIDAAQALASPERTPEVRDIARRSGVNEALDVHDDLTDRADVDLCHTAALVAIDVSKPAACAACLQAAAVGTAVVAVTNDDARELIVAGVSGVLVTGGRPARVADTTNGLLTQSTRRQAHNIAAADRASASRSLREAIREPRPPGPARYSTRLRGV